jgi:hypothetical protein
MGEFMSVPIHTAVVSDGVKPAIHASLFSPSNRDWTVPVFAATWRASGRARPSCAATPSIASTTLRATRSGKRRSPSVAAW